MSIFTRRRVPPATERLLVEMERLVDEQKQLLAEVRETIESAEQEDDGGE